MAETIKRAEELVKKLMKDHDASHDASHVLRVRDMALSLAAEEGLSSSPHSLQIVELAALLHDIGDYKYASHFKSLACRDPSEEKLIERFLEEEGIEENMKTTIVGIVKAMGFKEELSGVADQAYSVEFGVVQDADRLDAIGAIGIARCFTFGGSRNRVLHDPNIKPRLLVTKADYMDKEKQTTLNHFHEKLLKLKDLMKTQAGRRRAERRHAFMEEFMEQFYLDWDGKA
ncbi:hypothetical protein KSS87_006400 [Heliosperma pusillum]|nr:hypothetical protein KSS87_006400 [Heliosperma pusillum]